MNARNAAKPPVPKAELGKAKSVATAPAKRVPSKKAAAGRGAEEKAGRGASAEDKKPKPAPAAFSLAEIQSFIDQHHAGKGIRLPGRTADDIGTIHDAYNQSTYKYAERVLALLNRWARNPS